MPNATDNFCECGATACLKLTNIIIYFSIPEIWQPVCLNDCRLYRRYKKNNSELLFIQKII